MSREPSNAQHGSNLQPLTESIVLDIRSPSFKNGEPMPVRFTGDGENINPAITIEAFPPETKSLTLMVLDKLSPNKVFDLWIIWNIEPTKLIPENSAPGEQGRNGLGNTKYDGPHRANVEHTYLFRVYALDTKLDVKPGADRSAVEKAMANHMLAAGELHCTYHS